MQTFVITWTPGPRWIEDAVSYDQPHIEEHGFHLDQLMTEHHIVLSGPFVMADGTPRSSIGMTVVKVLGEDALRTWLAADPAIVHQVLTAKLRPLPDHLDCPQQPLNPIRAGSGLRLLATPIR
jgi:uncharacterized protein YciI